MPLPGSVFYWWPLGMVLFHSRISVQCDLKTFWRLCVPYLFISLLECNQFCNSLHPCFTVLALRLKNMPYYVGESVASLCSDLGRQNLVASAELMILETPTLDAYSFEFLPLNTLSFFLSPPFCLFPLFFTQFDFLGQVDFSFFSALFLASCLAHSWYSGVCYIMSHCVLIGQLYSCS